MFLFERRKSAVPSPSCVLTAPDDPEYTFYHVYVDKKTYHFHYEKLVPCGVYIISPEYSFTRLVPVSKYVPHLLCVPYLYWSCMPKLWK